MKKRLVCSCLFLVAAVSACGDGKPAKHQFRPDDVLLQVWEWYPVAPDRVELARIRVVAPDGTPVPGATVRQVRMPRRPVTPPLIVTSGTTDVEGRLVLADVPVNTWLMAMKEGLASRMVPPLVLGLATSTEQIIQLKFPGRITGVMKLADGTPVADYGVLGMHGSSEWFEIGRTDAEGKFTCEDVPPGQVLVIARLGAFTGRSPELEVREGETVTVEVTARRTPVLTGEVTDDSSGKPIAGAVVRTLVQEKNGVLEEYALTTENGRFRIENAYSGGLYIHADGYGEARLNLPPDRLPEEILVRLSRAMTLSGRVVDSGGAPIAGVRVSAHPQPDKPVPFTRGPLTREDGSFQISWVPAPPEGVSGVLAADVPGRLLCVSDPVVFRRGERKDGIVLRAPMPSEITGRLVDENGTPWEQPTILMSRTDKDLPAGLASMAGGDVGTFAGRDGRFRFRALRAGNYRFSVTITDRLPFEKSLAVAVESRTDIGDLVVPRGYTVAGKVSDATGGSLPQMVLQLTPEQGGELWTVGCDDKGSFRLFGLPEGRYVLAVSTRIHEGVRMVVPAGTEDLSVVLRPLVSLEVRIAGLLDDHPGGVLEIARLDGPREERTQGARQLEPGARTFTFPDLPRGRYRLRIHAGDRCGTGEVIIGDSPRAAFEIPTSLGGTIDGRVVDASGRPVDGALVDADAGPDWGLRNVRAGAGGVFVLEGMPPVEVTLRSRPEGHPEGVERVQVGPGTSVPVELALPEGGFVDIRAAAPAGTPVADLKVWLRDEGGEVEPVWVEGGGPSNTNQLGLLKFIGVMPGVYTLHVSLGPDVIERRKIRVEPGKTASVSLEVGK